MKLSVDLYRGGWNSLIDIGFVVFGTLPSPEAISGVAEEGFPGEGPGEVLVGFWTYLSWMDLNELPYPSRVMVLGSSYPLGPHVSAHLSQALAPPG